MTQTEQPWYRELNRYHWFVLVVCTLGWCFDCFNQQMFALNRKVAVTRLMGVESQRSSRRTAIPAHCHFDSSGGLGHRRNFLRHHGRPARPCQDHGADDPLLLALYRPDQHLANCLGLHVLSIYDRAWASAGNLPSACRWWPKPCPTAPARTPWECSRASPNLANVGAALVGMGFVQLQKAQVLSVDGSWRTMFSIGILPALLAVLVMRRLKEPERWQQAVAAGGGKVKAGFDERVVRRSALAEERHRGPAAGHFRRDRPVGHRLLQHRSEPVDLPQGLRAGGARRGHADQDRQFVRLVLQSPEALEEAVKQKVEPKGLLGKDAMQQRCRNCFMPRR